MTEQPTAGMSRAKNVASAKARALEYLDRGEVANALASMTSDLGKHDETRALAAGGQNTMRGILEEPARAAEIVRAWIEGLP